MVEPRDAATVLLVRDVAAHGVPTAGVPKPSIEIFMLRRSPRASFVAGAYVFPGGGVDLADRAPETLGLVDGIDDATASARLGRRSGALAFWVAAIREAFEEAGVLVARERATREVVRPDVAMGLQEARVPVASGELSFARLVADRGLVLDGGSLPRPLTLDHTSRSTASVRHVVLRGARTDGPHVPP